MAAKQRRPLPALTDFLSADVEAALMQVVRGKADLVCMRAGSTPYWGVFIDDTSNGSVEHVYGKFYEGSSIDPNPEDRAQAAFGVIRTMVLPLLAEKHDAI